MDVSSPHTNMKLRNRLMSVAYDGYDTSLYCLYFIARYLVLAVSYFLCMISILYAIGSLVELKATNFFSSSYSLQQVRDYNRQHGNEYGVSKSCFYVDREKIDEQRIETSKVDIFDASVKENPDVAAIFQTLSYSICAIIFLISAFKHTYFAFYDLFCLLRSYYTKMETNKTPNVNREQSKTNIHAGVMIKYYTHCVFILCGIKKMWSYFYFEYIMPYYYIGSKWRLLSIIIKEWIEIGIQFYALLLYGGINLFEPKQNILSQEY